MSRTLNNITKHARILSKRTAPTASLSARSFHSPFRVLDSVASPLTSTPPPSPYEKQHDHSPEPSFSASGTRTYVVSEPDPSHTPYAVPSGAYPTSAPYVNFKQTEGPNTKGAPSSSTSSQPAHPSTTRAVPHNESGIGESAAVRNSSAPGEMGKRGGGNGGLGLQDQSGTTKEGTAELASRNPPPDGKVAEQFSKAGVDEAWKQRK